MTSAKNYPLLTSPATAVTEPTPPPEVVRPTIPPSPPQAATTIIRQGGYLESAVGDTLLAQRRALLANRECKVAGSVLNGGTYAVQLPGHIARVWHICPGCFPGA